MDRFRVLSLDGGGIKGTFTASILANFESLTRKRIFDHFDLITGTSTGGLIALGLGLGMSAEDILRFYVDRGPQIFANTDADRVFHGIKRAFRPKYSQRRLDQSLVEFLGDRKLGDSQCRLVIPSYDCNAGRVQLFKTAHNPRFVQDYRLPAQQVAMATAAAPTYFPAFSTAGGQAFLDGGIWANCPIVVGLMEAIFVLGHSPASIDVLSIGTTDEPFDISRKKRLGGILAWNRQVVTLLMQAQIDGALAQAQIVTGKRAMRIDAMTRPGRFSLDDASRIEELHGLGTFHARDNLSEVVTRFLDTPADRFVPCHSVSPLDQQLRDDRASKVARRRRRRSLGIARTGFPRADHRIVDISATGALLETGYKIPIGNPLDLDLEMEDGAKAQVKATVTRVQEPAWGVTAGVGVRFTEFQNNAEAVIEKYVEAPPPDSVRSMY